MRGDGQRGDATPADERGPAGLLCLRRTGISLGRLLLAHMRGNGRCGNATTTDEGHVFRHTDWG
jgi:hypothetical protein